MPYQERGDVPLPLQQGQSPVYRGHGRSPVYRGHGQAPSPSTAGPPPPLYHAAYGQPATRHSPYAAPPHHGRGQPQPAFSQTPQYPPPYLSPPPPPTSLPHTQRYSPDPLRPYQHPPQPRRVSHPGYQPHRQPASHCSAPTPQAPQRPAMPPAQWASQPQSTYRAVIPPNPGSHASNSFMPSPQQRPQQLPQPPSQPCPRPRPGSPSSQHRPHATSEVRRPSPIQDPRLQQQNSQPRASSFGQSSPRQQQVSAPRGPAQQLNRAAFVNSARQNSLGSPALSLDSSHPKGKPAQVQVHVQRVPSQEKIKYEHSMAPSKRRRSSETLPNPVFDTAPQPVPSGSAQQIKKVPAQPQRQSHVSHQDKHAESSPPLTGLKSSQVPSTPTPASNVEYHSVLLSLSDEYITAAYSMTADLTGADVLASALDEYQNLLAAGMSCLDTVLKNCPVSDKRVEGHIRLRLASLLFEETENDWEAEETLSKGIPICERARLVDLKYAMHHLLARIWFKGEKHKAAMTAVDKLVVEAEKLQLPHWIYAFRFLRVTFSLLVSDSQRETSAMVKNLTAIAQTASQNGHHGVEIAAFTLEAMVHLKSRHPDSVDLAMRALAAARTHQLTPAMTAMPQMRALLDCIDLACTLARFNHELSQAKMQEMQTNMDAIMRDSQWGIDRALHVPLGVHKDVDMNAETGGVMRQTQTGEVTLQFSWLSKTQVYAFAFLLSGLSVMNKSASHEQKAETFLGKGIKLSKLNLGTEPQSLTAARRTNDVQLQLRIMLRLYVVFACCGRSDWDTAAKRGLEALRRDLAELGTKPDVHLQTLMAYLEGLCKHGLGDLEGALSIYRSADLALSPEPDSRPGATNVDPIKVLAALNSILIMRQFGQEADADELLQTIKPFCIVLVNSTGGQHGSKAVEAAFYIMEATSQAQRVADSAIITTKKFLQHAVVAAKAIGNSQLLCMVMNIMTDSFFHNIVGEQAEKSAKAGRTLALKSQDKLWIAVADGMYAETLEKCGKQSEAETMKKEAKEYLQRLPPALRAVLPPGKSK